MNLQNPFIGTNRYKGCQWSKRRAKRSTVNISDNPPPGTYDIQTEIGRIDPYDEYVREMARLFSYVPRSLEANELRILKEVNKYCWVAVYFLKVAGKYTLK